MATEHKDTAGNTLRETSSGWEILQKGVGWREFIGFTILTDGRSVDTMPKENSAIELVQIENVAIKEPTQKQLEDELFRHYAGIAFQAIAAAFSGTDEESESLAVMACDDAQAMIDELKKRGRL